MTLLRNLLIVLGIVLTSIGSLISFITVNSPADVEAGVAAWESYVKEHAQEILGEHAILILIASGLSFFAVGILMVAGFGSSKPRHSTWPFSEKSYEEPEDQLEEPKSRLIGDSKVGGSVYVKGSTVSGAEALIENSEIGSDVSIEDSEVSLDEGKSDKT